MNEITTLIYQDVFALDFLAYAVIFATQKLIWSAQTSFESYFHAILDSNLT